MTEPDVRIGATLAAGPFLIREVCYASGMRQSTHAHDYMSVTLVLSGHFRELVLRTEEIGTPLSVVVKPVGVDHSDEIGPRGARTLQIAFDPRRLLAAMDADAMPHHWRWLHGSWIAAGMLALLERVRSRRSVDGAEDLALDALGTLYEEPRARGEPPEWIRRVKERVDDEIGVALVELAREAGVHAVSVSRAFRRHYGLSINDYRQQLRLRRAAGGLDGTNRQLSVVAHAAGYADHAHLCRDFRRATGVTPSQYRALTREAPAWAISVQAARRPSL